MPLTSVNIRPNRAMHKGHSDETNRRLRLGVIGARTRRQGIGQHVARHFSALGHEVAAIAGSSAETAAEAQHCLQRDFGIAVRAYAGVDDLLGNELLDAVAICSPDRFHREHLEAALRRQVHILCEKPLTYESGRDLAEDARMVLAASRQTGKLLMVNEQWPYTLPTFARLHPGFADADDFRSVPTRIAMRLSPSMAGAEMIPNAVPHLLSLVWRLCPAGGKIEQIEVEGDRATQAAIDVRFEYRHSAGATQVSLALRQTLSQPRMAAYAIDGRGARRVVEMNPYRFWLEATDELDWNEVDSGSSNRLRRRVPMPDPLALLVADFAEQMDRCRRGGECCPDSTLVERQRALGMIAAAAERTFAS